MYWGVSPEEWFYKESPIVRLEIKSVNWTKIPLSLKVTHTHHKVRSKSSVQCLHFIENCFILNVPIQNIILDKLVLNDVTIGLLIY